MQNDRRNFLKKAAAGIVMPTIPSALETSTYAEGAATTPAKKPNIVLFLADEVRADFIAAAGSNPMVRTPNLDKLAARGTMFTHAVTNQPLCSPSRSCMLTGRYATETGVWKLEVDMRRDIPTLATILRENGYTANLIGKWHLSAADLEKHTGYGWIPPDGRGGFLDVWEGANVYERVTHPYEGSIWDSEGKEIKYQKEYRVDFLTDRVVRFLERKHDRPFLLYVSQLEPHFQNDLNTVVGPKGEAAKYQNPFVPADLRPLPGVWQQELPDYYAAIESIDKSVGRIMDTLEKQGILDSTIFIFTSDHGCHFKTRENNYKRTPHDASIRIPLIFAGPGVTTNRRVNKIAGNIHITPTLLDLCGIAVPDSMKGRSMKPMMQSHKEEDAWDGRELIQFSGSSERGMGRAIRTDNWTYGVARPDGGNTMPHADSYMEYVLFNNEDDPAQQLNLASRYGYGEKSKELREQLLQLISFSGDPEPKITKNPFLYP